MIWNNAWNKDPRAHKAMKFYQLKRHTFPVLLLYNKSPQGHVKHWSLTLWTDLSTGSRLAPSEIQSRTSSSQLQKLFRSHLTAVSSASNSRAVFYRTIRWLIKKTVCWGNTGSERLYYRSEALIQSVCVCVLTFTKNKIIARKVYYSIIIR